MVLAVQADVGQPDQVAELFDQVSSKFCRLDVLVNNAGVVPFGLIPEITYSDLEYALNVNIGGTFMTTKAAWPIMVEQGGGIVINVSSLAAVDPFPGNGTYGATKAWIESFTKVTAHEGAEHSIRAYAIRPGAVETPMLRRLFPEFPTDQSLAPEEIANEIFDLTKTTNTTKSGEVATISK